MQKLPSLLGLARKAAGFTMIELLIVITILGILAVAVLSAINPLEQINRGRDTARQGDAEQLLGALERYNAFQERFPWEDAGAPSAPVDATGAVEATLGTGAAPVGHGFVAADSTWLTPDAADDVTCTILNALGPGLAAPAICPGTDEVKQAYVTKLSDAVLRNRLFVFKADDSSSSNLYVCFFPQSNAFRQEAIDRCGDGSGLPDDFPQDGACPGIADPTLSTTGTMSCLP